MEPLKRSKLVIATLAAITSVLVNACGFPRPPDVGDDATACCVTPAECAQLGAGSPQPCPLGACVHNACTTAAGACDGDEDCGGATPVCADQVCSVCRASTSCAAATPVCDDTSHDCRACAKDNECGSGACDLAAGTCVDRGEILYASPGGTEADPCTTTSPCSFKHAAELVDAGHTYIVLLPGSHTSGATFIQKNVTIVGNGSTIDIVRNSDFSISTISAYGSSIRMRNFQVTDQPDTNPSEGEPAISVISSDLTIDNMQANTRLRDSVEDHSALSTDASTVTIRHSAFAYTSIIHNGRLIIDDCLFLAGGPAVSGGIDLTNSIIVADTPGQSAFSTSTASSASAIVNNTFIGGDVHCSPGQPSSFEGNIFYNHGTIDSNVYCFYNYNLIMPSLNVGGVGNTTGDPRFVDAGNKDYHLKPGSPAIDAADPASSSNGHDFDGVKRPQGTRSDVGAFEYVP